MQHYFNDHYDMVFQRNLADWCKGGPTPDGWTRTGPLIILDKKVRLLRGRRSYVSVDDVLSKNREEIERWHLSFLRRGKVDKDNDYYKEYLTPRYSEGDRSRRMVEFFDLLRDVEESGFDERHPVHVADLEDTGFDLGFRFFRFDGAHRSCVSQVSGIDRVPALVFTVEEDLRSG